MNETNPLQSRIWFNGRIVPREQFKIDALDPGLLYGLGLFETTRTFSQKPWLWAPHLARLLDAAEKIGMEIKADMLPDEAETARFVCQLAAGDVVVRLNVCAAEDSPTVWMFARPLTLQKPAVRLCVSPIRVSRTDPFTSLKCFNYGARLSSHRHAVRNGFDDALLLSADHFVLEAGFANVFFRFADGWQTPALHGGVLPGTVRSLILADPPVPVIEREIEAAELSAVKEAFVTNSGQGLTPVSEIDDLVLPGKAMSDECERFARLVRQSQRIE